MNAVHVKIKKGTKILDEYIVKRQTVGSNTRRMMMNAKILDLEIPESKKGQLLSCAAIVSVLCDKDGELIYPEPLDNSDDNAAHKAYNELDIEYYDALTKAYIDINPNEPTITLDSKKKKF